MSMTDQVCRSFKCNRNNKVSTTLPTSAVAIPSADRRVRDALVARGTKLLGTCIDMCRDYQYTNCATICTDADVCTNLGPFYSDNGVSSINFQGSTKCWVFADWNCTGDNRSIPVNQPNMRGSAFDDRTRSFFCHRDN
jgi:hypothetical protein